MFVYIHVISLDIHVLLCVDEPIDEDHVITHPFNVFSVLLTIFIFTITIIP